VINAFERLGNNPGLRTEGKGVGDELQEVRDHVVKLDNSLFNPSTPLNLIIIYKAPGN